MSTQDAVAQLGRAEQQLQAAFVEVDNAAGGLGGPLHSAALMARDDLARLIRSLHNIALVAEGGAFAHERQRRQG